LLCRIGFSARTAVDSCCNDNRIACWENSTRPRRIQVGQAIQSHPADPAPQRDAARGTPALTAGRIALMAQFARHGDDPAGGIRDLACGARVG
jgi:hypothetical protein